MLACEFKLTNGSLKVMAAMELVVLGGHGISWGTGRGAGVSGQCFSTLTLLRLNVPPSSS